MELRQRVTHLLLGFLERYDELAVALLMLMDEAGTASPVSSDRRKSACVGRRIASYRVLGAAERGSRPRPLVTIGAWRSCS